MGIRVVELEACTGPDTPRACTGPEHEDPAEGACTGPELEDPAEGACTGPELLEVLVRHLNPDLLSTSSLVAELDDSSPSFETAA
jgi:hypothetical protein